MESASVKQRPLKLGNALSFGIICAFATIYMLAVVEVPSMHTSESLLGTLV